VMVYGPGEDAFGDEYIAEKLSTRAGWNFASPDEHWASGYPQEIQDFAECVADEQRQPLSGWTLARDVMAVIYAAYVSAEEGRRVEVPLD
jgi:predicted dehydrogenase